MADHHDYMSRLHLDEEELRNRRSYFKLGDEDLELLAEAQEFATAHMDDIVEGFYDLILAHPEAAAFMDSEERIRRLKRQQRQYFLDLFTGKVDLAYVEDRLRVGFAHERIGLPLKWYMGSYSRYLLLVLDRLLAHHVEDQHKACRIFMALQKLVFFDATLAIDTYMAAQLDTLVRHQAAIRELSTPVIGVFDGVLLLPLVGTVDSHRAQQIMETVLTEVADKQARVLILDIAGVPVVDTQVADHLLKATAAVRLLGAKTILTGISPQVSRTIVELGVDISMMETRGTLASGIQLALSYVGRGITVLDNTEEG